jgi:DeoR family suf operon transcriptional repressor
MAVPGSHQLQSATPVPGPVGHKGPRGEILLQLKRRSGATAQELAEELGCSLNAVRHHLKELEADGFISYDRTIKGVGAPAHTWHLTSAGHALFPDRYDRTVLDLLDHIVASEGREAAVAVLEKQYIGLAHRLRAAAGNLTGADRGEAVARALSAEGYIAAWETRPDGTVHLVERHCPHQLLAERFPEICAAERRVLEEVLEMKVQRRCRIAGGCGTCSYEVGRET